MTRGKSWPGRTVDVAVEPLQAMPVDCAELVSAAILKRRRTGLVRFPDTCATARMAHLYQRLTGAVLE